MPHSIIIYTNICPQFDRSFHPPLFPAIIITPSPSINPFPPPSSPSLALVTHPFNQILFILKSISQTKTTFIQYLFLIAFCKMNRFWLFLLFIFCMFDLISAKGITPYGGRNRIPREADSNDYANFLHGLADKLATCNCNCQECWSTGQFLIGIGLSFLVGCAFIRIVMLCTMMRD